MSVCPATASVGEDDGTSALPRIECAGDWKNLLR